MCGSTSAQDTIQQEQIQAYQDANNMLKEEYAHQQAIYAPMAAKFQSIFDLGPDQEGFTAPEKQNLETQVIEGTGGNYQRAAQAVNRQIAADGGVGNMPSGAADELKLETANSAAQEKSREETALTEADYATGRQLWSQAGAGLMDIAAGENPVAYENAATSSGSAASTTANEIAQAQNSWINAAIGAAGTALGGWAQGGFKTSGG